MVGSEPIIRIPFFVETFRQTLFCDPRRWSRNDNRAAGLIGQHRLSGHHAELRHSARRDPMGCYLLCTYLFQLDASLRQVG